jgi:hypothetical protein
MNPSIEIQSPSPRPFLPSWPAHAARGESLEDLVRIYERSLTLVTAPSGLPTTDVAALDALAAEVPPFEFVKETSPEGEALEFALPWMEGHAGGPVWLAAARPLVALFAELFEADRIGARLTLSDTPMCPRFHVDNVVCRLVVALSGAGSEFLANDDVRRKLLGPRESSVERAGALIHRLEPREVGLFKGEAWPDNAGNAIVHRSPEGRGRRLVMTLDLL